MARFIRYETSAHDWILEIQARTTLALVVILLDAYRDFFKAKKIIFSFVSLKFLYEKKKNRYVITSICLCRDLKLLIYLHFFAWEKPLCRCYVVGGRRGGGGCG